jgi:hypothetical protein
MPEITMTVDYAKQNLQNASFQNENLVNTSFLGSDLRGANFSGADLTGANLTQVKTGITPLKTVFIFLIALSVSMLSGYVAMLAGSTVQTMLSSGDEKLKISGFASLVLIAAFIGYYYWKGYRSVTRHLLVPVFVLSIAIGSIAYFSGLGTGKGMFFLSLSLLLVVIMVTIGTVGRAVAGVLSSTILFIIVALGGGMFGKSLGGGIGTVFLAVSCALISKRALSGAKGFESLRRLASLITGKWGTSFRNANLNNSNFSQSVIHNADFTNADLSFVNWGDSKKQNCTPIHSKV